MVSPIDKQYDIMMRNRTPQEYRYSKYKFFSEPTKKQLSRLFKLIIENEKAIEKWKKKLSSMSRFSSKKVFDKIDNIKKTFITREDVCIFIKICF